MSGLPCLSRCNPGETEIAEAERKHTTQRGMFAPYTRLARTKPGRGNTYTQQAKQGGVGVPGRCDADADAVAAADRTPPPDASIAAALLPRGRTKAFLLVLC